MNSWMKRSNARAGFEFVIDMDEYEDLEWWDETDRGRVDYWTSYEFKELHIIVHLV